MIKLLERLNKSKLDNKKIFAILLICFVVAYFDLTAIINFQIQGIKTCGKEITDLKRKIDMLSEDLITMQKIQKRQKDGEKLRAKKIISEGELPSLLQYLSDAANKHNIKIMQIRPVKELKPKQDRASLSQKKAEKSVSIILDLVSDYHSFGTFINELENGQIYVAMEEMKISSDPSDYFQQKINLSLKTYVKK